ncbi:hypothetical protein JXB02_04740 [Candidatus Woesearchaeota archaeon]|nr:hypothetical protein [Candidatus Woesearchaeota archaeon]
MAIRYPLLAFSLAVLLLLAGCGPAECEQNADCVQKTCHTVKCVKGICTYSPLLNCCGNGLIDRNETKCSCPEDVGACEGVSESRYFQTLCVNDECVMDIVKDLIDKEQVATKMQFEGFELKVTAGYANPFNLFSNYLNLTVELSSITYISDRNLDYANDITITSIELTTTIDGVEETLATIPLNLLLERRGDGYSKSIILKDRAFSSIETTGDLTIRVSVDYGKIKPNRAAYDPLSASRDLKLPNVIFLKPTTPYACASDFCDDGNDATEDECVEGKLLCIHTPIPGICGNLECESTENKCSCAVDCGTCEGDYSDHLEWRCVSNSCVKRIRDDTRSETKLLYTDSADEYQLITELNAQKPIHVGEDSVSISIQLSGIRDNFVGPLEVTRIELVDGEELLGKKDLFNGNTLDTLRETIVVDVPIDFSLETAEQTGKMTLRLHYNVALNDRAGEPYTLYDAVFSNTYDEQFVFVDLSR